MKKLLSLLSVLTISGTAVPTTIAASSYQKEKLNSDTNYKQMNNSESLKRNKRQGWRPAECFNDPIDYNRTIRWNNNGTWEYDHPNQYESNCLWQKAIREANIRAQQKIQEWNNYFENQRIQQQQYNYNQQIKRQWEKNQLLDLKQKLIQAEHEGATLSPDLKSAFKIGASVYTATGGALVGATLSLACGPVAPDCVIVTGVIGAFTGSVASEVIDRI